MKKVLLAAAAVIALPAIAEAQDVQHPASTWASKAA